MTWLSWRLQRTETLVALGILGLLAALLVPTGLNMWDAYQHNGLGACLSVSTSNHCMNAIGEFRTRFQSLSDTATWFTLLPGLIGVLLAAPFVSDLEHGTYRLAWTQSITRGRWLLGRLGLPVLTALLASGALIALFTWWRSPMAHLDGRLENGIFDTTGTVMIGYTLFALGLALAVGAVWRRTAVSLVAAFVGYFAARIFVDYKLRLHLVAPVHATWRGMQQAPASFTNAHVMNVVEVVNGNRIQLGGGFSGGGVKVIGPNMNSAVFHAVYQPVSHFWPLQLTETALFAGLALLLIAFAAWRVLGSD
jgi:ABC-type transport system involved in multi-copper enzyme maturation permease subunit